MTRLFVALPPELVAHLREVVFVVLVAAFALGASALVGRAVEWLAVRLQAPRLTLRPLVVTGRFLVLLIALSTFADHFFGVDFFALMGGVLALIAIGFFAVWSTLSNVLCSLFLLTVRPFHMGDEVELLPDPVRGRVTDLNLFFTTLATDDGRLVQIPNNLFFQRVAVRRRAGTTQPLPGTPAAPAAGEAPVVEGDSPAAKVG